MSNEIDIEVGRRIRIRRWALGLSQQDLASEIGVRFQQVQKYETGSNRVSASRLWMIAQVLKVNVEFFFAELGNGTYRSSKSAK
jgi:transcriptional regulator with XRE-family HTH domain